METSRTSMDTGIVVHFLHVREDRSLEYKLAGLVINTAFIVAKAFYAFLVLFGCRAGEF